jgi:hypothetical protein
LVNDDETPPSDEGSMRLRRNSRIFHEARAIDKDIIEKAKAAGIDVLGIINLLMAAVTISQHSDGNTKEDVIKVYESFLLKGIRPIIGKYNTGFTVGIYQDSQHLLPVSIALFPDTGLMEHFQDATLKKIKVKDALHDLYEPKRILGLLFGYLTGIAEDNKAKIDELKSALQYAKELTEGEEEKE